MLVSSFAALSKFARRLRKDKSGVTAIEYGLIAGGIAVAIVTIVYTIGGDLKTNFQTIDNQLTSAGSTSGTGTGTGTGAAGN